MVMGEDAIPHDGNTLHLIPPLHLTASTLHYSLIRHYIRVASSRSAWCHFPAPWGPRTVIPRFLAIGIGHCKRGTVGRFCCARDRVLSGVGWAGDCHPNFHRADCGYRELDGSTARLTS